MIDAIRSRRPTAEVLTDNAREMNEVLRYLNGISAKRLIDHLKENEYTSSLAKLRIQERNKKHKHSVYEHHPTHYE